MGIHGDYPVQGVHLYLNIRHPNYFHLGLELRGFDLDSGNRQRNIFQQRHGKGREELQTDQSVGSIGLF